MFNRPVAESTTKDNGTGCYANNTYYLVFKWAQNCWGANLSILVGGRGKMEGGFVIFGLKALLRSPFVYWQAE